MGAAAVKNPQNSASKDDPRQKSTKKSNPKLKEDRATGTIEFYIPCPDTTAPVAETDNAETRAGGSDEQLHPDEQDLQEQRRSPPRQHITSVRGKENKMSDKDDEDDTESAGSEQPREVMQPRKSVMSNSSKRLDGKTGIRSVKPTESSQSTMSKSSSTGSDDRHSIASRDSKDSKNSDNSASLRDPLESRQSKSDEHFDRSTSKGSDNPSFLKSSDNTDSIVTGMSASSRESDQHKNKSKSRKKKGSKNVQESNNLRNTELSASSMESTGHKQEYLADHMQPTKQIVGNVSWNSDDDNSPQYGKNRTQSSDETPNTDSQSDHITQKLGAPISSAKPGQHKPSESENNALNHVNNQEAPIEFREEKQTSPANDIQGRQEDRIHTEDDKIKQLPSDPKLTKNLEFYQNRMRSRPRPGFLIEEMLRWRGDYRQLEINHRYIQWLFPIPESSDYNLEAQPLQAHEAITVREDRQCRSRFLKAYEMMLDFYGMRLVSMATGEVARCDKNWKQRFAHLNKSGHNYLRITRILKALACFGLAKYQKPWINFFLNEVFVTKALSEIRHGAVIHWIDNMDDTEESADCLRLFQDLHANMKGIPQSQIQAPVEESDSESEGENETDKANSNVRDEVGGQPLASDGNTNDDKKQFCNPPAREKRRENQIQNLKFYKNEITSKPDPGSTIEEMLSWKGKYEFLEEHGYYIQWLFPIPDTTGVNDEAQPLRPQEIQALRGDKTLQRRFLEAYKMMLGLYGLKLKSKKKGTVGHADNWNSRYDFLDGSNTAHKQITRIIKALECFGFPEFQQPLVSFLINEIFVKRRLDIQDESVQHWINIMADDNEKIACAKTMVELLSDTHEWSEREEKQGQLLGSVKNKHIAKQKKANSPKKDTRGSDNKVNKLAKGSEQSNQQQAGHTPHSAVTDNVRQQHNIKSAINNVNSF